LPRPQAAVGLRDVDAEETEFAHAPAHVVRNRVAGALAVLGDGHQFLLREAPRGVLELRAAGH
jgi:hypothetical protein